MIEMGDNRHSRRAVRSWLRNWCPSMRLHRRHPRPQAHRLHRWHRCPDRHHHRSQPIHSGPTHCGSRHRWHSRWDLYRYCAHVDFRVHQSCASRPTSAPGGLVRYRRHSAVRMARVRLLLRQKQQRELALPNRAPEPLRHGRHLGRLVHAGEPAVAGEAGSHDRCSQVVEPAG